MEQIHVCTELLSGKGEHVYDTEKARQRPGPRPWGQAGEVKCEKCLEAQSTGLTIYHKFKEKKESKDSSDMESKCQQLMPG